MYSTIIHQQQNKWYPQIWCLLPISILHSILDVATLLAPSNLWLCYYVQVNSLRLK